MALGPGALRRAYYQWRMMRFPWRRKWLVGFDLQGNTFWEFKDALHQVRNRRIAKYARSTHYGDVNVSPSWMQWLRHTRPNPPTLAEQHHDLMRQERMKLLAAQADERWASKPSALDKPDVQQPVPMLQSRDVGSSLAGKNAREAEDEEGRRSNGVEGLEQQRAPRVAAEAGELGPEAQGIRQDAREVQEVDTAPSTTTKKRTRKEPKDSPWKQAQQGNPGEDWQPQGWSPAPARRRA